MLTKEMFHPPSPRKIQNEDGWCLKLQNPVTIDIRVDPQNLHNGPEIVKAFADCRRIFLQHLVSSLDIFRTKPTLTALESICPPWGYCATSSGYTWSKYSLIFSNSENTQVGPILYTLVELLISRSFIMPVFNVTKAAVIDIAFGEEEDELHEVEDIPSVEGGIELVDPVRREEEKRKEKEEVRELFRKANEAASNWIAKYGFSDDESAFSDESDNDDDERNFVATR
jgi:hypothetical protein